MTDYKTYFDRLKGKKVGVFGIGISNTPLIHMLKDAGAIVYAGDKRTREALKDTADALEKKGVKLVLDTEFPENMQGEIIFRTPGIRPDIPKLTELKNAGSRITSEMEVFFELCPADIYAVTGSDGKTTTTTLVYEILKKEGYTCHLGGNIGKPLLPEIAQIRPTDKVVLELSSFQLQTFVKSPKRAVITNLSPNHLNWHTDMQEYIQAKTNIYTHGATRLVTNADNEITAALAQTADVPELYTFSRKPGTNAPLHLEDGWICFKDQKIVDTGEILLPGVHNIENYMAAIGMVWTDVSAESIAYVAKHFGKIPHRIEFTREVRGVRYYNDSIATSPTRAMAGLNSFDHKVIVIAGGYDKNIPFDSMGETVVKKVKKLVLLGKTAPKIRAAVEQAKGYTKGNPEIVEVNTMQEAVLAASKDAVPGDAVLLCPACASFDMYENFEARGNHFKQLVMEL